MKKLTRVKKSEAKLLGVCGGLAKYLEIDPTLVRVGVAVLSFVSMGAFVVAYIIAAFIMPVEGD